MNNEGQNVPFDNCSLGSPPMWISDPSSRGAELVNWAIFIIGSSIKVAARSPHAPCVKFSCFDSRNVKAPARSRVYKKNLQCCSSPLWRKSTPFRIIDTYQFSNLTDCLPSQYAKSDGENQKYFHAKKAWLRWGTCNCLWLKSRYSSNSLEATNSSRSKLSSSTCPPPGARAALTWREVYEDFRRGSSPMAKIPQSHFNWRQNWAGYIHVYRPNMDGKRRQSPCDMYTAWTRWERSPSTYDASRQHLQNQPHSKVWQLSKRTKKQTSGTIIEPAEIQSKSVGIMITIHKEIHKYHHHSFTMKEILGKRFRRRKHG